MKILVTGSNGFVGRALCLKLVNPNNRVIVASRRFAETHSDVTSFLIEDVNENTDWSSCLAGCNIVIHLAARVHVMNDNAVNPLDEFRRVNTAGTEQLARSAARAGVKRFVYVSSVKVNGEETEHPYTEQNPPNPQDAYGVSKWEAEQALRQVAKETGLEVVIVRPPLVYGAGVKGNFLHMLKVLARGFPLPLACVHNRRDLIYVGNLVDALMTCATHPNAAGKTYLVSDGEDVSTSELIRRLSAAMGRSARLLPCPPALMRLAGRLLGKSNQVDRLLGSLQVDSSNIKTELGWQPPFTLEQGLKATADWYLQQQQK